MKFTLVTFINAIIILIGLLAISLRIVTYALAKDNMIKLNDNKIIKYKNVYSDIFKILIVTVLYCTAIITLDTLVISALNKFLDYSKSIRATISALSMLGLLLMIIKAILDFNDANNERGKLVKRLNIKINKQEKKVSFQVKEAEKARKVDSKSTSTADLSKVPDILLNWINHNIDKDKSMQQQSITRNIPDAEIDDKIELLKETLKSNKEKNFFSRIEQ